MRAYFELKNYSDLDLIFEQSKIIKNFDEK